MTPIKNFFAGILDSGNGIYLSNKRKSLLLTALATIILFSVLIGIVIFVVVDSQNSSPDSIRTTEAQALVKSSCSCTLYPELCYSTIASHPNLTKKVKNHKNVIEILINITITTIQENYFHIKKLITARKGLTKCDITALHDCLEMVSDTLDELHDAVKELQEYKQQTKKSLRQKADDLKTLMSSAITNQETCLDGFSDDSKIREVLKKTEEMGEKMCCNALAMICNMTNADLAANEMKMKGRKTKEVWPEWLSTGDRRLLQSGTVKADVVVAADGTGNYMTVAAAVAAAPSKSSSRYVIRIKAGVYRENVEVPSSKMYIMFMGDGRKNTIITGSRSVKGGSRTLHSATVG